MQTLADAGRPSLSRRTGLRSLALIGGLIASAAAVAVGAVLALFFAATMVVIGLLSAALIALAAFIFRARKAARAEDPTLIEAHHVGGHSWVAYGWDRRGR